MKRIRSELNTSTQFAEFRSPLEDQGLEALLSETERRGEATDTSSCDYNGE